MTIAKLDPATLTSFQHAAAGHEGPMSDPTGKLFIKPCTQTEVTFYETANASYPALAAFMPTYMGTLNIASDTDSQAQQSSETPPAKKPKVPDPLKDAASAKFPGGGPLKGRKIATDLHIVLANAAKSFTQANVLDLKLGAQLWDHDALPEKRARLDAVSRATTSGSCGFRIAGMRTWQGPGSESSSTSGDAGAEDDSSSQSTISPAAREAASAKMGELDPSTNIFSYNKFYGRQFSSTTVLRGFRDFVLVPGTGISIEHAIGLTRAFLDGTRELQVVFEGTEMRMFGGSILFTYEGDGGVFDAKYRAAAALAAAEDGNGDGEKASLEHLETVINNPSKDSEEDDADEDDDDDEEDKNVLLTIKVIDFAHARFVPGEGPDENILRGVRSIVGLLEQLLKELEDEANSSSA